MDIDLIKTIIKAYSEIGATNFLTIAFVGLACFVIKNQYKHASIEREHAKEETDKIISLHGDIKQELKSMLEECHNLHRDKDKRLSEKEKEVSQLKNLVVSLQEAVRELEDKLATYVRGLLKPKD